MIRKHLPAYIFILFVILIYLFNLSRSVYGGDVGDLVTAASIMGVAHPPGYPLFTLVGFLLTRFAFLGLPQAFLVGLISVFSAGSGLLIFYFLSFSLSKNRLSAFFATAVLAFVFPYWFYAEIAEVFALNSFFAITLFALALWLRKKLSFGILFLFSLFLGLSLTNHQTIIFIFPSLLLLIICPVWRMIKKSRKTLFFLFGGLLLGLSPFIYIPFAASRHPIINWDNVHDILSFLHLVLRQDYGTFQAGIFDTPTFWQRLVTLKVYGVYLLSQLTIPVVFLSSVGLLSLWKKDKNIALSFLLAFLLSGPLFIGYAGFPLTGSFILGVYERFFTLSCVILLMSSAVGVLWLARLLRNMLPRDVYITVFQLVFFAIPLALLFYNFPKTNLSSVMIGDTYAEDLLDSLPPHSLLVFNGDTLVFNTWYVHYVRHFRPDVTIYNFGGEVQNQSAGILQPDEKIKKQSVNKQDSLVDSLIQQAKVRPVFSTILIQSSTDKNKITWVPYGLAYQLTRSSDVLLPKEEYLKIQNDLWGKFRIPTDVDKKRKVFHNLTIAEFPTGFSNASLAAGTFLYTKYNDSVDAEKYYQKAIALDPSNAKAYEMLGTYYMGVGGKCPEVAANLTAAIDANPFEKLPYFLLYATYKDCFHKKDAADVVKNEFTTIFQSDFDKEIKKESLDNVYKK